VISGMTGSTTPEGPGFLLCSAAPTAPGAAFSVSGRGLEALYSSKAWARRWAHAGPAAAA
jgi:hypothetical protein